MALYTTLTSLSQTAASNAADGSVDAPASIDQQLNLLASFIAQLRDAAGGPFGAWTSSTPTPTPETGAFTTASAALRYKIVQKTFFFNLQVFLNNIGTGAGGVFVTLPIVAATDSSFGGRETVTSGIALGASVPAGSSALRIYKYDTTTAIVNNYRLVVNGVMEIA